MTFTLLLTILLFAVSTNGRWHEGTAVRSTASEVQVRAALLNLNSTHGRERAFIWQDEMRTCLGAPGVVVSVELGGDAVGVLFPTISRTKSYAFPTSILRKLAKPQRSASAQAHIVNSIKGNHPPEFTINPMKSVVTMFEDQGELQNGDYWACGVSDCNGDVQDLLFRFNNGDPQLPNPDPCLVNMVPRVTPPAPDNDADTYFTRGPLATRRLMNVAPISNCPGGGVGCGGGGRQWPEDPNTGERVPNTCVGTEEPTCDTGNAGCPAEQTQGRYWCKWPDTLQLNPLQPALPGGVRCTGVPQRCTACPAAPVPQTSQCQVRCYDDTRSGGAHARLEADPSPDHFGYICWDVRAEDDGIEYVIPNVDPNQQATCNCQPGGSTVPCNESPNSQRACIHIQDVNDCPVFKVRGDAVIFEDSATCTGSPNSNCDPAVAGGGAGGVPGCLLNLGGCCCPTFATGCMLQDWIYDINQGAWNEHPYQTIYFDVSVDNPDLFDTTVAEPCVEFVPRTGQCGRASDDAFNAPDFVTRNLNFKLRPDACGKTRVSIIARDDGGDSHQGCSLSKTETFELDVQGVNDPPVFEPGPLTGAPVTVDEDSGVYHYGGWASNLSPGPGQCEAGQIITFDVQCGATNQYLFSVQPEIDPVTGDLTFTPALHEFTTGRFAGDCVPCQVVLRDNGGTANGGDDTSDPPTMSTQHWNVGEPWPPVLCITVTAVNDPPYFKPESQILTCEDQAFNKLWAGDLCIGGTPPIPCATNEADPPESQTATFSFSNYDTSLISLADPLAIDPANGILTFTPAAGVSGTTEVLVTMTDTGSNVGQNQNSFTQRVMLTVVPVNDEPTATVALAVINAAETTTATETCIPNFFTNLSPGANELTTQRISTTLLASPTGIFAKNPTITLTSPTTATLCYTLEPNANGESTVELTVRDDGGNVAPFGGCGGDDVFTTRFVIRITPTNDPPVVRPGDSVEACEDSGIHNRPAWGQFLAGLGDEQTEPVTVTVVNNNNALFASQPTISGDGLLAFTTAPDMSGEAELTITVTDQQGLSTTHPNAALGETAVRIKILEKNDPPQFTVLNDQLTIAECATTDPQSACKYTSPMPVLGNIAPGPPDEASQNVISLQVIPDPRFADVFAYLPVIDQVSGRLTLETLPGKNTNGQFIPLTIEAKDDGLISSQCGGTNTYREDILVRVTGAAGGNPSYLKGTDIVVNEDSGAHVETQWAKLIDYGTSSNGQALNPTFACVPVDATLFTVSGVIMDAVLGTISFTPAPDRFGSTQVTCTLNNGVTDPTLCCASDTFTITVRDVNDKPTFTLNRMTITIPDIAEEQTIESVIRSSFVGPFEETTQTLSFSVTPQDPEFLVGGASTVSARRARIDVATGNLLLTPIEGKLGTTTLTVRAIDTGGTARQGVEISDPLDIILNIVKGNRPPSLVCGIDAEVSEDACSNGAVETVMRWATGVTAGSEEEDKTQQLTTTVTITAAEAAKFSVAPTLLVSTPPRGVNFGTPPLTSDTASLQFCPAPNFVGNAVFSLYLEDDAGATSAATPCAVTVRVLSVNDAPTVVIALNPVTSLEDEVTLFPDNEKVFAKWALLSSGDPPVVTNPLALQEQTITPRVELINTLDQQLFSKLPYLVQSGTQTGTVPLVTEWDLRYRSAANVSGSVPARICVLDNGGQERGGVDEACVPFTIAITPVNDAPSLSPSPLTMAIPEDSPEQVLQKWARLVSVGPSDEAATQNIISTRFSYDNDNNRRNFDGWGQTGLDTLGAIFFKKQPVLDLVKGDLSFEVTPDAFGTLQVDVIVQDDGGVENGGVDTTVYNFLLQVTSVNDRPKYTFAATDPISLVEDNGHYEVVYASGISSGNSFEDRVDPTNANLAFSVIATPTPPNANGLVIATSFKTPPEINSKTGLMTLEMNPDVFGNFDLSVVLSDGSLSSIPLVTRLEVRPVNDKPSFSLLTEVITLKQSANDNAQTASNVVYTNQIVNVGNTSVGPSNEVSAQTIGYTAVPVSTTDANFFKGGAEGVAIATDGTILFEVNSRMSGEARLLVTAKDNGGTTDGGVDTATPILLTVNIEQTTFSPFFALKTPTITVDEDAGDVTLVGQIFDVLPGQTTGQGMNGDSVRFVTSLSDPNLINGNVQVSVFNEGGSGTSGGVRHIRFRTVQDAFGETEVTITAFDEIFGTLSNSSQSFTRTIPIRILPVNDPPSFSLSSSISGRDATSLQESNVVVTSTEDQGGFFIRPFAVDISAGPPNELNQRLEFETACVPLDLFSSPPTVSAENGELAYTSAPQRSGVAECTVVLKDDGGCPSCVGLTSSQVAFRVNIQNGNDPPTFSTGALYVAVANYGDLTPFISPWATNVVPGPVDETIGEGKQTVSFNVGVAELFSQQLIDLFAGGKLPEVTVENDLGTLRMTPSAQAKGSANFRIFAVDSLGAASTATVVLRVLVVPLDRSLTGNASLTNPALISRDPTLLLGLDVSTTEFNSNNFRNEWLAKLTARMNKGNGEVVITDIINSAEGANILVTLKGDDNLAGTNTLMDIVYNPDQAAIRQELNLRGVLDYNPPGTLVTSSPLGTPGTVDCTVFTQVAACPSPDCVWDEASSRCLPPSQIDSDSGSSLGMGAIIGIVAAVLAFILILAAIIALIVWNARKKESRYDESKRSEASSDSVGNGYKYAGAPESQVVQNPLHSVFPSEATANQRYISDAPVLVEQYPDMMVMPDGGGGGGGGGGAGYADPVVVPAEYPQAYG